MFPSTIGGKAALVGKTETLSDCHMHRVCVRSYGWTCDWDGRTMYVTAMKTIEVLEGTIPVGAYPVIEVHTWLSPNDETVTLADVRLSELMKSASTAVPALRMKLLRRRAKMSREAAIEFAMKEAEARGLTQIYDTTASECPVSCPKPCEVKV